MKICIIGSGGREHALAWRMAKDPNVKKIIVIPGNPGMENDLISTHDLDIEDIFSLSHFLSVNKIDLTIIGPEKYLDLGIVDPLESMGHVVLGPNKAAAKLESSKSFSKEMMDKFNIPTAKSYVFDDYYNAIDFLNTWDMSKGVVVKADGLAAGKGVVVTFDKSEAMETIFDFMKNSKCSVKATRIIIEQCLNGVELSAFALCDGNDFQVLGHVTDYKRVYDNDKGPNTGGMGTYSSPNWPSTEIKTIIAERVFRPMIEGMKKESMPFKGILFAGLMLEGSNINVIEFNVRFGDPEAQALLPLLEGNLTQALFNAAKSNLKNTTPVTISNKSSVHVVMCSTNYPSIDGTKLLLGHEIILDKKINSHIFYSGVQTNEVGKLVNSSGRVLGVTCLGDELEDARANTYKELSQINFEGAFWRSDIAKFN